MDKFYEMGKTAALERLALNALLKQRLAGGAVGAGMGALAGGEEHRGTGAIGGGLLGALGGQALGRHMQGTSRKAIREGIQTGMTAAGPKSSEAAAAAGRRLGGEAQPMVQRAGELAFPTPGRVMG